MRRWLIACDPGLSSSGWRDKLLCYARPGDDSTSARHSTVTRGDVQQLVTASGKLVNTRQTTLSMGASGQLAEIDVRPGDRVKQGQVLATLDTTDLEQAVAQAEQTYLIQQAAYSSTLQPMPRQLSRRAPPSISLTRLSRHAKLATNQDQITVSRFNTKRRRCAGPCPRAYEPLANDFQNRHYDEAQARKAMLEMAQNNYDAELARCNLAATTPTTVPCALLKLSCFKLRMH
jgi:multidrug efflux pump subunit AcrA (membrane-fusion protein)